MKVIVIFEFNEVDLNSEIADNILAEVSKACEPMKTEFGANACWVDDATE